MGAAGVGEGAWLPDGPADPCSDAVGVGDAPPPHAAVTSARTASNAPAGLRRPERRLRPGAGTGGYAWLVGVWLAGILVLREQHGPGRGTLCVAGAMGARGLASLIRTLTRGTRRASLPPPRDLRRGWCRVARGLARRRGAGPDHRSGIAPCPEGSRSVARVRMQIGRRARPRVAPLRPAAHGRRHRRLAAQPDDQAAGIAYRRSTNITTLYSATPIRAIVRSAANMSGIL